MPGSPTISLNIDLAKIITLPDRLKSETKKLNDAQKAMAKLARENKAIPAQLIKTVEEHQNRVQDLKDQIQDKKLEDKLSAMEDRAERLSGGFLGRGIGAIGRGVAIAGLTKATLRGLGNLSQSYFEGSGTEKAGAIGQAIAAAGGVVSKFHPVAGAIITGVGTATEMGANFADIQYGETAREKQIRLNRLYGRYTSSQDQFAFGVQQQNQRGLAKYQRDIAQETGINNPGAQTRALQGAAAQKWKEAAASGNYPAFFSWLMDSKQWTADIKRYRDEAQAAMGDAMSTGNMIEYERARKAYEPMTGTTFRSAEQEFSILQSTTFAKLNYAKSCMTRARLRSGD